MGNFFFIAQFVKLLRVPVIDSNGQIQHITNSTLLKCTIECKPNVCGAVNTRQNIWKYSFAKDQAVPAVTTNLLDLTCHKAENQKLEVGGSGFDRKRVPVLFTVQ